MTSGVKQALPQILMPKPNADRQVLRNRSNDRDFGEALGVAGKGKQEIASKQEAAGEHPVDAEPRWPRFGTKLDAAIDRTAGLGTKLSLKVAEPEQPDVPEASDEETLARDDAQKPAAAEDADAVISFPLPGIHIPPVQARRISDVDGEKTAPINAPVEESDIVAAPIDDRDSERGMTPIGDDSKADGERDAAPIIDDGKSRDRLGKSSSSPLADKANSSSVMDIAKADAGPAAATPEQASKPLFANPASEPKTDDTAVNPERSPADAVKVAARAAVVSEQNFPAPMQSTALVLATSIASSGALIPAADRPPVEVIQASIATASAQSLKIQLHPAELGMVTATLRFVGEQLSIELKVENNEAYQRLSTDSETIVRSLRGLGFDIERITVMQPSIAPNAPARLDGSAAIPAQAGRGAEQFGSGATAGGNAGTGGQQPGREGADVRHGGEKAPAGKMDRTGGGLYI